MTTPAIFTISPQHEVLIRGPAVIRTDAAVVVRVAQSGESARIEVESEYHATKRRRDNVTRPD